MKIIKVLLGVSFLSIFLRSETLADVTCYSCSGIACQRTTAQNRTVTCSNTGCATVFEESMVVAKGCLSEIGSAYPSLCSTESVLCDKCTTNLCNNHGRSDIKCLSCNSKEISDCVQKPQSLNATVCPAPTAESVYCYVKYFNGTTTRGCATEKRQQKDCQDSSSCNMCSPDTGEKCNSIVFPVGRSVCIVCSGNSCPNGTQTFCDVATDSCISMKTKDGAQKKCVNSLSLDEIKYCTGKAECCKVCKGRNCNSEVFDPESCGCSKLLGTIWLSVILSAFAIWKI